MSKQIPYNEAGTFNTECAERPFQQILAGLQCREHRENLRSPWGLITKQAFGFSVLDVIASSFGQPCASRRKLFTDSNHCQHTPCGGALFAVRKEQVRAARRAEVGDFYL
jgi:hypothetical protein